MTPRAVFGRTVARLRTARRWSQEHPGDAFGLHRTYGRVYDRLRTLAKRNRVDVQIVAKELLAKALGNPSPVVSLFAW